MYFQETMHFLCICIYGSKSNPTLWEEMFEGFDFEKLITGDRPANMYKEEEWRAIVADALFTLQNFHKCKFPYTSDSSSKKYIDKHCTVTSGIPDLASDRLRQFVWSFHGCYKVFCSNPKCKKACLKDGVFKNCGRCTLARYCR